MNLYILSEILWEVHLASKSVFGNITNTGCTTIKRSCKVFGKVIGLIGKWFAETVEKFVK